MSFSPRCLYDNDTRMGTFQYSLQGATVSARWGTFLEDLIWDPSEFLPPPKTTHLPSPPLLHALTP